MEHWRAGQPERWTPGAERGRPRLRPLLGLRGFVFGPHTGGGILVVESRGSVAARLPSGIFISHPPSAPPGINSRRRGPGPRCCNCFRGRWWLMGSCPFHPMSEYGSNACSAWGPLRCQTRRSIELWKDCEKDGESRGAGEVSLDRTGKVPSQYRIPAWHIHRDPHTKVHTTWSLVVPAHCYGACIVERKVRRRARNSWFCFPALGALVGRSDMLGVVGCYSASCASYLDRTLSFFLAFCMQLDLHWASAVLCISLNGAVCIVPEHTRNGAMQGALGPRKS